MYIHVDFERSLLKDMNTTRLRCAIPTALLHSMLAIAGAPSEQAPSAPEKLQADELGRLTYVPGKEQIPCPKQDGRTAVLLLIGQSNGGNWAEKSYVSNHGAAIVNFHKGNCYVASSPLVGAHGERGEYWTALGNLLIEAGTFERVIIVPAGVGGSAVARWADGGDLNAMLMKLIEGLRETYTVTHVLWHQGERDYSNKTPQAEYMSLFGSMVDSLRRQNIDAPVFVSVVSKCGHRHAWVPNNPVTDAQRALVNPARGIYAGIDTDTLVEFSERYDGCHFGAAGQEKSARAWAELLAKHGDVAELSRAK